MEESDYGKHKTRNVKQIIYLCSIGVFDFHVCMFFRISKPTFYRTVKKISEIIVRKYYNNFRPIGGQNTIN